MTGGMSPVLQSPASISASDACGSPVQRSVYTSTTTTLHQAPSGVTVRCLHIISSCTLLITAVISHMREREGKCGKCCFDCFEMELDPGSIRSSPRDGLSTPYRLTKEQCLTVPPCPYLHGRTAFGPSCTVFVYPGCWYIDNGATSKFDDVLLEQ